LRERGEPIPEDRVELVEVAAWASCPLSRAQTVWKPSARLGSKFIGNEVATS